MAEEKNETIKRAKVELEYLTGDEEVKRLAYLREKWEMDWVSGMNYAKIEGIKEGIKKAKKKEKKKIILIFMKKNLQYNPKTYIM